MINLITVDNQVKDLSVSPLFVSHYNKANSFAKYIIDNEINNGMWFDQILKELPDDAVIIDAGMNVGMFTVYLNKPNAKVYGIEPDENHIEIAEEVFHKLGIKANIFEGVLFNISGTVKLLSDQSNTTMTRVNDTGFAVRAITLKDFFERFKLEHVDLFKCDIEGAEAEVFLQDPTIDESLQKCSIVFVETHDGMDGKVVNVPAIRAKLESLGFTYKPGDKPCAHYFVQNKS